jgi:glycosyltransferase involved in cell wall biosynthesis
MPGKAMTRIAVLLPCFNEAVAIGGVVKSFQKALPHAHIYVYDNNSTDATSHEARAAGAEVVFVKRQGKGAVVNRMFADIEADVYLMADGDGTYEANSANEMIELLTTQRLDMVCGQRKSTQKEAYRQGHKFGNFALTYAVRKLFGNEFLDMLTGYRVFSRRFVKSFPVISGGFEIETELAVHSLVLRMPTAEIPTPYYHRPEGSESKLSTYKDGCKILMRIFQLVLEERPLHVAFLIFSISHIILGILALPVIFTYFETGLVPRFPTLILIVGLSVIAFLFLFVGLILNAVSGARKETKRLAYLSVSNCD